MRALLSLLMLASAHAAHSANVDDQATQIVRDLFAKKYDQVFKIFSPEMAAAVPKEQLAPAFETLISERGPLLGIEFDSKASQRPSTFVYAVNWTKGKSSEVILNLNPAGQVEGLLLHPDRQGDIMQFDTYLLKAKLRPPFSGKWRAGNAALATSNPHFTSPNQRFAVDWVMVNESQKTHDGDGKKLTDYFCYGREAKAVANSVVVTVIDGVPENEEIGNSGNTSEPHLHFQVMNGSRLAFAQALPVRYSHGLVNGKPVRDAVIGEGDILSSEDH